MGSLLRQILVLMGLFLLGMMAILAWSRRPTPEQSWLLFRHCPDTAYCDLYRLHPDTKTIQWVARKTYRAEEDSRWEVWRIASEPGWLYFNDSPGGKYDLYRVRVDGTGREQLTDLAGNEAFVATSPDGQWLIFRYFTLDFRQVTLYRMRPDGTDLTPIISSDQYDALAFRQWLPRQQAFLVFKEGFYHRVSMDDWQITPVLPQFGRFELFAVVVESEALIIRGRDATRGGIFAANIATNTATLLYDLNENQVLVERFFNHPQRKGLLLQIVNRRDSIHSSLVYISADGSGVYRLTTNHANFKAWSPDGEWILYYHPFAQANVATPGLYRVRIDGTARELIANANQVLIPDVVADWSPDGQWLFLTQNATVQSRMRVDGTGFRGLMQNLPNIAVYPFVHWSVDSEWVIFTGTWERESNLYRVNIATGHAEQLAALPNTEYFVMWLPMAIDLRWHGGMLVGLALILLSISITRVRQI